MPLLAYESLHTNLSGTSLHVNLCTPHINSWL